MDKVNLKNIVNLKNLVNLKNKENLKYKINKYIKKGKFNIQLDVLDVSEYTYNLLKHKYINNKMIGGANITLNDKSLYHIDLHGALLTTEYVKVPDNLIVILPSCCGKSNFESTQDKLDIIKKISSSKDIEYDTSQPVILNEKKHFIYTGGEEICNIDLGYDDDYMILTNGIVFDMENNKHSDKDDFGLLNFDKNIMKRIPLRTDDFVISEYILKFKSFQEISKEISEYVNKYEKYNMIDERNFTYLYNYLYDKKDYIIIDHLQFNSLNSHMIKFSYEDDRIKTFFGRDIINLNDIYSTFYKNFFDMNGDNNYFAFSYCLMLTFDLCVYALYFCMYDEDINTIQETLKSMTSLKLINKKIILNFVLPTYYFKNKEIINRKIKKYDYNSDNSDKFDLIASYIKDNIISICTPPNKDEETIESYYEDIQNLIINSIIYFYPFIVYYFHEYSDLSIDFVKMINEQDGSITLNDVFDKFSKLKSDKQIIVYINSCQDSVSNEEMCYLHKCIKTHTKKINEIDIDDKIFNIKNPARLLANIYEKTIIFNIYFKSFLEMYLSKDEKFNKTVSFKNYIKKFFKKIDKKIVDTKFIEYFDNFIRYIQNKYEIDYTMGNEKGDNKIYMILYSFYIIQIMYDICEIIINNKIEQYLDYLTKDSKKDTFMYYTLKKYLTIDKNEKDTFMYYAQKKDIKRIYGMINNHIV